MRLIENHAEWDTALTTQPNTHLLQSWEWGEFKQHYGWTPRRYQWGSAAAQVFRSVKTSEIAGLLGRFGPDYKQRFQDEMKNNERAETFYNNIVMNRHGTAHTAGANLTFSELVSFYSEGHVVLDAVKTALEV